MENSDSNEMKVVFLGTGTSQGVPVINCDCCVCQSLDPKDNRLRTSISLSKNNMNLMVDIGPDFRLQLLKNPLPRIDAVFLTHEHNDHIIGLDDLRPFNFSQKEPIEIYALPRVVAEIKNKFHYAFAQQAYPGAPSYSINKLVAGESLEIADIRITAFEVIHGNLPILCFRFNDFVYITDAKTISEESKNIIKGCKVLVLNALRREEHWSHLTLQEALELIDEIKPERAYLTHMSHLLGKHEEVSQELPDHVFLAYDGLELVL